MCNKLPILTAATITVPNTSAHCLTLACTRDTNFCVRMFRIAKKYARFDGERVELVLGTRSRTRMRTPIDVQRVTQLLGGFFMSAFLFEETFSVKLSKVSLLRPVVGRPFSIHITSPLVLNYAIHFIGSAFVCPGEESCPACGTIGKRTLSLLVGGSNRSIGLLEVGTPTMVEMVSIMNQHSLKDLFGTTWSFVRRAAKRPLVPTLVQVKPEKMPLEVDRHLILEAFAKLFTLPPPAAAMDAAAYDQALKPALEAKLKRALLQ